MEFDEKKCNCCGRVLKKHEFPPNYNWCKECLAKNFK